LELSSTELLWERSLRNEKRGKDLKEGGDCEGRGKGDHDDLFVFFFFLLFVKVLGKMPMG
jgi:hypothetical protein